MVLVGLHRALLVGQPLSPDLPRSIALDADHNALAAARGKELRASRSDLVGQPSVGDSRVPRRRQGSALIGARRKLGTLKELAAHVPHNQPGRGVNRRERVGCRASRVMAVAHAVSIASRFHPVHAVPAVSPDWIAFLGDYERESVVAVTATCTTLRAWMRGRSDKRRS